MRLLILLVLACFVATCSYELEIVINGNDASKPTFTLKKPLLALPLTQGVPLKRFDVLAEAHGTWDYDHPVWSFESEGQPRMVGPIVYGVVPRDFKEQSSPKPLEVGVPYRVEAVSSGGVGWVEFAIHGDALSTPILETRKR